jgi:2C-methyl-D-erythritol 2,4-cyclodiphosphate synthase
MPHVRAKTWKPQLMRARRKELGHSMDDLHALVAEIMEKQGVKAPSRSTMYLYERPSFTPHTPLIRQSIAKALEMGVEDLYR